MQAAVDHVVVHECADVQEIEGGGDGEEGDGPTAAELKAYRARPLLKGKIGAKSKKKYRDPLYVTDSVMRVHPGLLVRLQKIANRIFTGTR